MKQAYYLSVDNEFVYSLGEYDSFSAANRAAEDRYPDEMQGTIWLWTRSSLLNFMAKACREMSIDTLCLKKKGCQDES